MSDAVQQFVQILRDTWLQWLYCETCGRDTRHIGCESGDWEIYTCPVCQTQKRYKVH